MLAPMPSAAARLRDLAAALALALASSFAFAEETNPSGGAAFEDLVAEAKSNMMGAPEKAYEAALASYDAAAALPASERQGGEATALWLKAEAGLRTGRLEEGLEAAEDGLALTDDLPEQLALKANLMLARGRLAGRLSRQKLAVTSYFQAHKLFVAAGDTRRESITLQSLGSIYRDAKSYDKALEYFSRAAEVYDGDDAVRLSIENNVGNILRDAGRFDESREYLTRALAIAETMGSDILVARVLNNIVRLDIETGQLDAADRHLDRVFTLLDTEDGAYWARFAHGHRADIAVLRGETGRAVAAIEAALRGVDTETTNMEFTDLHETAAAVYRDAGDWKNAYLHHVQFKRLSDEALSVASSSNLAVLGADFQFAEQELNIQRLKNDQLENAAKLAAFEDKQRFQQLVIASGSLLTLLVFAGAVSILMHQRRIAQINTELSDTVNQLSTEIKRREKVEAALIEARDRAEAADRTKSVFLATMSHELRTPMNGILGFTEVLLAGDLTPEQREQIEIIDQSSGSLLTLINDILDLSQLEAGKFKLRKGHFDVRVTAENAVKLLRAKAQEKHLNLIVDIDRDIPTRAFGDEDRIRQVLLNLVGNAVKFTERGGILLRVSRDERPGSIHFSVEDSGIGIPESKCAKLFERFAQIDGSQTRKYAGSGLGLAICKELVAAMGGEIGCASRPGEGTTFFFSAPLFDEDDLSLTGDLRPQLEGRPRIAIADDFDMRRMAVERMLTKMGAEAVVLGRHDGEEQRTDDIDAVLVAAGDGFCASAVQQFPVERLIGYGLVNPADSQHFAQCIDQPITDTSVRDAVFAVVSSRGPDREKPSRSASAMQSGQMRELHPKHREQRVLIVDDVAANRKLVECILKQMGVTCVLVENGQQAVDIAHTERFGLILMDCYMPVMGGIEAARLIKSGGGASASTPIFALTASASMEERNEAVEAGMEGVLTKPLDMRQLRRTVMAALKGDSSPAVTGEDGAAFQA